MAKPRILFVTWDCYLDDSNGAAVSSREQMELLLTQGFKVEVLCGVSFNTSSKENPIKWLYRHGMNLEYIASQSWNVSSAGVYMPDSPSLRLRVQGVPITLLRGETICHHQPDISERRDFLALFEKVMARFRPDIIVGYGGTQLQLEIFARARARGLATVFSLHNLRYTSPRVFDNVNKICVPSNYAAQHYRDKLGINCVVIPNPVAEARIKVSDQVPKYATFVNPSDEKGVRVFARIADELGRRRPDIPMLVVESLGTEVDVASCGLDLRRHGTVFFMKHTHDPRRFYRISRTVLMPSLVEESFGRVPAEAMCNGIPVLASNRGALPETLGLANTPLSLPTRLTPKTKLLPTAEEVEPWVQAIARLWDDPGHYEELRRRALKEAQRWSTRTLAPRYVENFTFI